MKTPQQIPYPVFEGVLQAGNYQATENLSYLKDIDMSMQTIEISDAVYKEIMSRRIGREAISKTIQRELKPVKKCAIRSELEQLRKEPTVSRSEFEKSIGI